MKIHRFIGNFELAVGPMTLNDSALTHQMRDVLKLRTGEQIGLCDGRGAEARAEIRTFNKDAVEVDVTSVERNLNEPAVRVVLYCAILKSDNFDLAAQKATEVGASEIVPILTDRTVKEGIRYDRVRRIMREAAEQSGRGVVPQLSDTVSLADALTHAKNRQYNLFFDISGQAMGDLRVRSPREVGIFIGPEGGWETGEVEMAKKSGCLIASLGTLALRAETAAIVGTYLMANAS